ncbi:MAG: serine hydrolase [Candidatus Peregrinibacteria bacterium]|nr:serine hydrolase [Candidatus Peregrinibacteria bacterium]
MYSPVIAVLLMGMVPVWDLPPATGVTLEHLLIAAPSPLRSSAPEQGLTFTERLSASGVLVMDLQSGQFLYGKEEATERAMASLTKLMTALIIVENHALTEWVTVPDDLGPMNGSVAYLPPGHQFTVGDLLSALLISSANDAAEMLARYHSGSEEAFAEEMNTRAAALGLKQTSYENAIGFDNSLQWSTPQDIAWLATFLLRHESIRERMSMRGATIHSRQGETIHLTHTHALIHANTPVVAGKTGTTDSAGECLLSLVEEGGREYLVIILHSLQRYADMRVILEALAKPLA